MEDPAPFDQTGDDPGDGTATIVRPKKTPKHEKKRPKIPRWNVVLWNDDDHTVDYVVRMLKELFGHTETKGLQIADTVDSEGRATVLTTTKEHAELKRDQILAYGKDDAVKGCAGSMSASIEEVG